MRAVIVDQYGADPVVANVPTPEPKSGQLLVKLAAAGMNPMDRVLASGDWRPMPAAFPMVLGADFAGTVETVAEGTSRFSVGQRVFGQSFVAPLGSAGTYAEYVAVAEDAPLAGVPEGMGSVLAAALPTAGMTALQLIEDALGPLEGRSMLIVGAAGGVGSFATQFAANAGAHVIAYARAAATGRMRQYGAQEVVEHGVIPLREAVRPAHPAGVDVLLDLVSEAETFESQLALVRPGGVAATTRYVADATSRAGDVTRVNFALQPSGVNLERVADAVVTGRIVAPPVTRVSLDQVPAFWAGPNDRPTEGKTVVTLPG